MSYKRQFAIETTEHELEPDDEVHIFVTACIVENLEIFDALVLLKLRRRFESPIVGFDSRYIAYPYLLGSCVAMKRKI